MTNVQDALIKGKSAGNSPRLFQVASLRFCALFRIALYLANGTHQFLGNLAEMKEDEFSVHSAPVELWVPTPNVLKLSGERSGAKRVR